MRADDRLRALVDPAHTSVLTMELQKGVVGDDAFMPTLAVAVREAGILPVAGRVCASARAAGARVVHATAVSRSDGAGEVVNCRILAISAKSRREGGSSPIGIGTRGAELVDEIGADENDIEVPRLHGMTPFTSTALDQILRNLGITTVIVIGVSLNVGVIGAALGAVDRGYQVVVVRDAVAGVPASYATDVLDNSIAMIATIVTADELVAAWQPAED